MFTNLTIANDNAPAHVADDDSVRSPLQSLRSNIYAGDMIAGSGFSPIKPKVHITRSKISQPTNATSEENLPSGEMLTEQTPRAKLKKSGRDPVYFLFLLWLFALAAIVYGVVNNSGNHVSTLPLTLSITGLGILSVMLTGFAQKRRVKIIHSLGISMASLCCVVLLWTYLQSSGRSISPEILAMGLSGASLIMARIWQSPYLLNVSLFLGLGWSVYAFMAYQPSELAWVFPALWAVQMFFALEFRITRTVLLSIVSGLVWIGVNLPLLNL